MQPHDELDQRLLELVYDLLPDDEAAALRRRIETEPDVAEAYSEARRTANLLAEAARVRSPRIQLARPTDVASTEESRLGGAVRTAKSRHESPWAHACRRIVSLAAAVLLIVTAGGFAYHRWSEGDIAEQHLRLVVTGPAKLEAGATGQYSVSTSSVTGTPLPVDVEYAVYSPDGAALVQKKERTDRDGRLQLAIPAQPTNPKAARLEVIAVHHGKLARMQTDLPVDERRFVTQLSLDKPLYQPGEIVYYRSLTLGRFGLDTPQEMPVHFELHDPSGAIVAGSELEGITERGVGSGAFQIPAELPGGKHTLVARSLDQSFPDEKRNFFIRRYRLPRLKKELEFTRDSYAPGDKVVADFAATRAEGGAAAQAALRITGTVDGHVVHQATHQATPAGTFQVEFTLPGQIDKGDGQLAVVVDDGGTVETMAKTIRINLGKVEVNFYPEGGDLVNGLENRVYFIGRNPLGEPVHIEGHVVDAQGREVTKVETTHKGMGLFEFTPKSGESYTLKITKPAGITSQPKLPDANAGRHIVLAAGAGVVEPGGSIDLDLRSDKSNLPLVVSAYCRGVQVGQQALAAREGPNPLAFPLAPEAAGVIRLTVFDYSSQPPQAIAERLVYRRPDRKLNVRVADHSDGYTPGEPVQLSLLVTNEKGAAVPAALGVAVVDDALLKLADDDTPKMPTHFYLTTEVEKPEDLEKAEFYLSDDPKAPTALDLLLGTQGWRRFVEKKLTDPQFAQNREELTRLAALGGVATPPAMFDNLTQVQREYHEHRGTLVAEREQTIGTLGTVSACGGMAVMIVVVMLGMLRLAPRVRFCLPTLASATACLVVGLMWMNPDWKKSGHTALVQFAEFTLTKQSPAELAKAASAPHATGAPAMQPEFLNFFDFGGEIKDRQIPLADLLAHFAAARGDQIADNQLRVARRLLAEAESRPAFGGRGGGFGEAKKRLGIPAEGIDALAEARFAGKNGSLSQLQGLRRQLLQAAKYGNETQLEEALKLWSKSVEQYRFTVREYAHKHVAGEPGVRSDFAETVFWHPLLIAGPDGRVPVQFELSDSVTTFRLLADAHDGRGRIGGGGGEIISRIPFSLEPKLPLEVNAGDRIDLPVAVNNDTRGELPVTLSLSCDGLLKLLDTTPHTLTLKGQQRAREYFSLSVVGQKGDTALEVQGTAGRLTDAKKQSIKVVPPGFPMFQSYSGTLTGEQHVTVTLPREWVSGSLEVTLSAFPSTLADLQKGVESILQEPYGCFEQCSTSTYPNIMTLQYMQEHKVANPEITRRAKDLLNKGYARLTGYECRNKGYEWFGGDPGHEALSAYGLMEFRDMAQVYAVDPAMIERTAQWLLSRRDGKGGFQRNARALDSFGGAPPQITDAYIVWALSESGQSGIDAELAHVVELGKKSDDPYLIALAAASAVNGKLDAAAKELLDKLAEAQAADGHLDGKQGSITRSGGESLAVETTSLAALSWLKVPTFHQNADKAVQWIIQHRQGTGGWGSTQATILALKALVAHAAANRKTISGGELVVRRDGETIGRQTFGAGHDSTITVEGLADKLRPGDNHLTISISGDNQMPYALDVRYMTRTPASHADCPIRLTTTLAAESIQAGDTVALRAELLNTTDQGQPMSIAILGLPAGLQPRADQLEQLKKSGTIDYYETRSREVICYWRSLAPSKKIDLKLDLVAEWPGHYTGPASRAYLYYTAEQKHWAEPLAIEISHD